MQYVDLVIDNNTDSTDMLYTYGCEDENIAVGDKVRVSFAKSRSLRDGYVFAVSAEPPEALKNIDKLKYIDSIDEDVSLTEEAVRSCEWMRRRYLCRYIEAVKCFTPAGEKSKRGKKRNPYKDALGEQKAVPELNEEQRNALSAMREALSLGRHKIFLLHGVTGSGKTEVYMHLIAACIENGRTAVMMVPEISLTPQIIDRFIGRFGAENIAVLHSKLSKGERYDEWQRISRGEVKIVIGARSAVFAPLKNIGVFILDEEHESTYKSDSPPKYETVEVAVRRAMDRDNQALVVLGSATPSVVSYQRAESGIYEKLTLSKRYNEVELPHVATVDMRQELKDGNKSIFSRALYSEMKSCLDSGKQVILFLNRRGYSTFISCRECGYVLRCPECGISLTYHKNMDRAVCHYCGRSVPVPRSCPDCGSKYMKFFGAGTEKIEESICELFPEYAESVARLDIDTVSRKGSLNKILSDFRKGKSRILIGTQLVAKGLDFANVGVVGIVSADVTLNIPDFRSPERTFQLLTQAAGRAGRGEEKGSVVIQTYSPEHYAISCAAAQDYDSFYRTERLLRQHMEYPPYSDLIQLVFSDEDAETARALAEFAESRLKELLGEAEEKNVFPAQSAHIPRALGVYRYYLLAKCPKGRRKDYLAAVAQVREESLKEAAARVKASAASAKAAKACAGVAAASKAAQGYPKEISAGLQGGIRKAAEARPAEKKAKEKRKTTVTVDVNPYSLS